MRIFNFFKSKEKELEPSEEQFVDNKSRLYG